jgi:VWFA-related protein
MRLFLKIFVLTLMPIPGFAQTLGQNAPSTADGAYTLTVRTQLVTEAVVVKDRHGRPIQNLTAKDFVVTEDGKPQRIRFCEYQSLTKAATLAPPSGAEHGVTIYRNLNRTQISADHAGSQKYKDRRLMALYFDFTTMLPGDQYRALQAAEQFVRSQMTQADLVSIIRYTGGSVDVLQDFSADRNHLLSILQTMLVGEGQGLSDSLSDASSADVGAAFGQDDAEFNVFNTDRQLSALQTTTQMLGNLNEKKVLVYFAGGLHLNGVDNQAQLRATIDSAIRTGVAFWPIDARGLVAAAPLGDATQGSPGNAAMYTGASGQAQQSNLQTSQDALYALASDTGGKAFLDNNDLGLGLKNAQLSISDYYVISYYTTNSALDGRYRRVQIRVRDSSWSLDYRRGYYAGKQFDKFTAADKERQLEDALMLDDPITELTIAAELNYFQLNSAEYFVPLTIKIPGRELALAKRGGAEHTLVDFVGEIKDASSGMTLTNLRDNVNVRLTDSDAAQLTHRPIVYDTGFTLLPGKYLLKVLARDDETGRIGTYETAFTIPNLNMEQARIPISSVVLSNERIDLRDALYNATKGKEQSKQFAADPLITGNQKLIPSVTRVFSKSRPLFVYLQGYTHASDSEPLIGYVSLYQGNTKLFDTKQTLFTTQARESIASASMKFTLDLKELPPGQYQCQVTVLAPKSSKTQFWRGDLQIAP